ncbi:hypothetical protein FACUT_9277 [Fusarium acutatum]|uniref:Uncharacterized protein n=1 Tax=Fusarium acutatum TaxID=78861 RepID=A0A8H4NF93_9HYPO|nr:hypothetical protein FACUT_9277 [Fusarium acutatum]
MKPTVYPKRLQDAKLFFSASHKDLPDENTVDESDKWEAEPSVPSRERPRTNPVTPTHSDTESLFPKQPRRREIAVSAMARDRAEVL